MSFLKNPTFRFNNIVWSMVLLFTAIHLGAAYGLTQVPKAYFATLLSHWLFTVASGLGITAGAHRLWTHRSYKAKLPLRILLAVMFSTAFQYSLIEWTRDHRIHHKYSETNSDPHNAKRGFFFSHIGWILVKRHPDLLEKEKTIGMDDLYNDPVVMFQHRNVEIVTVICSVIIPVAVPLLWGESLWVSFFVCVLRIWYVFNSAWTVNSFAHLWGNKPYDKTINPSENWISIFFAIGEGFHNYHHVFPHDYATSEYGTKFNFTTVFIDTMAYFGLAYDCRTVDSKTIQARKQRTGER